MKKLIVCPKPSGNTFKVCDAVAGELGVELKIVDETTRMDLEGYDIVVLASGVYGNHVHNNLIKWIENLRDINSNTRFYLFLTWFGRGNSDKLAFKEVKNLMEGKGIELGDNYMQCFGKGMGFVRRSHPNEEDCKNVLSWVKNL